LQKQKAKEGNIAKNENAFVFALLVSYETNAWYIDSKTSMHIFFHKKWFHDYENIIPIKVYMGNNLV